LIAQAQLHAEQLLVERPEFALFIGAVGCFSGWGSIGMNTGKRKIAVNQTHLLRVRFYQLGKNFAVQDRQ
jgi:hypothetical protein